MVMLCKYIGKEWQTSLREVMLDEDKIIAALEQSIVRSLKRAQA